MNGDEAMCFGSAFIASNSSASFKVRKVYLTQHPPQAITIKISPVDPTKVKQEEEETVSQVIDSDDEAPPAASPSNGITYERTYQLYRLTDYLGQRKTLSLNYDTNMKVDVFAGEDEVLLSTFTINGIDEIAESDLQKKDGVTKPKVSL